MSRRNQSGMWLEALHPGLVVEHAVTRTVAESDNILFSCLTMNPQPLHLDADYASRTEFGRPLLNSLFTLGLVVGITVPELTLGTTVANLGFDRIEFPAPVYAGDTIWVESEVVAVRPSASRPDAGVVLFEHRGMNQNDIVVCRCRRSALVMKAPKADTEAMPV
jgi:acyl dehydratase